MRFDDVTAVIVTRNADANPHLPAILESLPYGEVIVYDNSFDHDQKVYGRYIGAERATRDVIFFQDDDVLLSPETHEGLLESYEPGVLVSNMYDQWIEDCGYFDLAMVGLGSIQDKDLWQHAFARYWDEYPEDDRFWLDADFIYGALTPFRRIDFGGEDPGSQILPIASAPDRLWRQKGQHEGKWDTIHRARALRKVVLAILTKNEEANIHRALLSAQPWTDHIVLLDSGSTDHTRDIAAAFGEATGIPVHFIIDEWWGFGKQRNRLLRAARQCGEYILMMDADEELVDLPERPELWADGYALFYDQAVTYAQPRLIASRFPFKFDEVDVHASLDTAHDTFQATAVNLERPRIKHHGDDRSFAPGRVEAQIKKLTRLIEDGVDVPRHLFLRGKAYEGADMWFAASEDYARRVDEWPAGDEEHYYSRFRLGTLYVEKLDRFAEGCDHLYSAWMDRPTRIESIRALAYYLTAVADATPYPKDDLVLVHRELYRVAENHSKEG